MNYIKIFRGKLKSGMTVLNANTGAEERIGQIFMVAEFEFLVGRLKAYFAVTVLSVSAGLFFVFAPFKEGLKNAKPVLLEPVVKLKVAVDGEYLGSVLLFRTEELPR